ncbi:MAG: 16S rRNA (guanine(966)-N(2))-methyltransferase RsmD [Acidimicrobiales bacterium]|nr:16S rRNA (guanine(966)-N(2))-methyltransferase RsmD [Acidimicrobiales bacterium]
MRVVAGTARGRPLSAPPGRDVRPTTDRVREAVFNALGSLGWVDGARVLDLFAGSGAMGIEALSRGACAATLVERDRAALVAIRRNLSATGLGDRTDVVAEDAWRYLRGSPAPFDLAVLDPPYVFDRWAELLDALPAPRAVLESDREPCLPPGWEVVRCKRYGATVVTIARRSSTPPE